MSSSSSSLPTFDDVLAAVSRLSNTNTNKSSGTVHNVTPVMTSTTISALITANLFYNSANSDIDIDIDCTDEGEWQKQIADVLAQAKNKNKNHHDSISMYAKCENFQKVGAFKFRGAYNAAKKAYDSVASRGLDPSSSLIFVTHSSGNHAAAVALASSLLSVPSFIVMPSNAPSIKRSAVQGYGGRVVTCGNSQEDRESTADRLVAEHAPKAILIPPYDHRDIIAGAGTCGFEFFSQLSSSSSFSSSAAAAASLDAVIVPVGGGGLLAGMCLSLKAMNPKIHIFAAEPHEADDCYRSIVGERAGTQEEQTGYVSPPGTHVFLRKPSLTIADGLRTSTGPIHNFPIIRRYISGVIRVSERAIVRAQRLVMERMKVVIEPSAATTVAAMMSKLWRRRGPGQERVDNNVHCENKEALIPLSSIRSVGVIFSGGNTDLEHLPFVRAKI